jgi:hypothetical protein
MRYLIFILILAVSGCKNEPKESQPVAVEMPAPAVPEKLLVIPGQSIGHIALAQNSETLEPILGKPDLSDAAMGKAWLTWFSKVSGSVTGNELNVYTTYKDNEMREKVVRQIRITSRDFRTADGLHTGKPLADFQKIHPDLKLVGQYDHETSTPISVYDDAEAGIAYEFENGICSGIIVHERGRKVADDYLAFHPDMHPL